MQNNSVSDPNPEGMNALYTRRPSHRKQAQEGPELQQYPLPRPEFQIHKLDHRPTHSGSISTTHFRFSSTAKQNYLAGRIMSEKPNAVCSGRGTYLFWLWRGTTSKEQATQRSNCGWVQQMAVIRLHDG